MRLLHSSVFLLALAGSFSTLSAAGRLRVCFDENNLPYSNSLGQGYENKIAQVIGRDLGMTIVPVWYGPRKGFVAHTLKENRCDAVMQAPAGISDAVTSNPYYRSTYVFVYRRDHPVNVHTLHDAVLQRARIGAQIVANDYCPPVRIMTAYGIAGNLTGYSMYGKYGDRRSQARVIDAVSRGDVDIAIAWGPVAGYFARREKTPLVIVPIPGDPRIPSVPVSYAMSIGLSLRNRALKPAIDRALEREKPAIGRILRSYGVPLVESVPTPRSYQ
jgi:mxaJ protein